MKHCTTCTVIIRSEIQTFKEGNFLGEKDGTFEGKVITEPNYCPLCGGKLTDKESDESEQ